MRLESVRFWASFVNQPIKTTYCCELTKWCLPQPNKGSQKKTHPAETPGSRESNRSQVWELGNRAIVTLKNNHSRWFDESRGDVDTAQMLFTWGLRARFEVIKESTDRKSLWTIKNPFREAEEHKWTLMGGDRKVCSRKRKNRTRYKTCENVMQLEPNDLYCPIHAGTLGITFDLYDLRLCK